MNVEELLTHLELEYIEENIYRGSSTSIGSRRVYGGQVLAQALQAASLTVTEQRLVHSLHAYFILPGDVEKPIIYNVDRTRDGGSFSTRRVSAIQNGRDIFVMAASFQKEQEGFEHQIAMPDVPGPDELATDAELVEAFAAIIPESIRNMTLNKPIEFKPVEVPNLLSPTKDKPFQHLWLRAKGSLPDDQALHRTVLAYASDYNLLMTAIRPHEVGIQDIQMASLDHAMWFHRHLRMDEWLLYALDSPSASNSRGFTRGNLFDTKGRLVATVAQEGMIRKKRKTKEKK